MFVDIRSASLTAVTTPDVLTPSVSEAVNDRYDSYYAQGCQADNTDTVVVDCAFGDTTSDTTVVLIGDSHAGAWFPALDVVAKFRGWKLVPMTKNGCSTADIDVYSRSMDRAYPECTQWREAALQKIEALKPAAVIIANRWSYDLAQDGQRIVGDSTFPTVAAGTTTNVDRIEATGAKVIYLRDVPWPGKDAQLCLSKNDGDVKACAFSRADEFPRDDAVLAAAKAAGASIVDVAAQVCPPGPTCPVALDNVNRYRDTDHMTATFSRTLSPLLYQAFPKSF